VIVSRALPLKGTTGWSSQVDLYKDDGDGATLTPFDIKGVYPTEEAATEAAIAHGCKKIDDGFSEL
jgi:hypothetical protein